MRRAAMRNNLHQMAAACLAHEAAQGYLPTGGWVWGWAGDPNRGFSKKQPGGWHYNILPYLDQADLHDLGKGVPDDTRKIQGSLTGPRPVAAFICPTRRKVKAYPQTRGTPYWYRQYRRARTVSARSDYAANGGDDSTIGTNWQGPASLAAGDAMTEPRGKTGDTDGTGVERRTG